MTMVLISETRLSDLCKAGFFKMCLIFQVMSGISRCEDCFNLRYYIFATLSISIAKIDIPVHHPKVASLKGLCYVDHCTFKQEIKCKKKAFV